MPFPSSNQLNANIQALKPSATLAINERSAAMIAAGKIVYRLGFGQSPFPVPADVVEALKANAHVKDYLAVEGLSWLRNAMATIASETFTSVSAPIQMAAIKAFDGSPSIDEYVVKTRRILKGVGLYVHGQLTSTGLTMPLPEGGFYLFPNFEIHRLALSKRGILNSTDLCESLLKEVGAALLPGVAFGRPQEELTARLSYVDFDGSKALGALGSGQVDEGFIKLYCPNVAIGVAKLAEWFG